MFDKLFTVALNPSLDVTLWTGALDWKEPIFAYQEKTYAGGKSLNVSRVLKNLGVASRLYCIAGMQNRAMLTELLDRDGIDYRLIETNGAVRENISLLLSDGRMLTVNRQGMPVEERSLSKLLSLLKAELMDAANSLVLFAGSLPPSLSAKEARTMMEQIQALGGQLAIDSDAMSYQDMAELSPFLIKPNLNEAKKLTGCERIRDVIASLQHLSHKVTHILLSMGKDGAVYIHREKVRWFTAPPVPVRSTVGAGDSTLAGFLAMFQAGKSGDECARYGVACGTASVTLEGTAAITPQLAQQYLSDVIEKK